MKSALLPMAAFALASVLPAAVRAQDCASAIQAVEQHLNQVRNRDDWNRAQVQLYIATQMGQEEESESCLEHVRQARAVAGMPAEIPAGTGASGTAKQGDDGYDQQAATSTEDGPAGANIIGRDSEGWGHSEAQGTPMSPEQAKAMIDKPVQSSTGEQLGTIVDVLGGGGDGAQRFVIATGDKRVPVPASKIQYNEEKDVVIAEFTPQELEEAPPLQGGTPTQGANTTKQ